MDSSRGQVRVWQLAYLSSGQPTGAPTEFFASFKILVCPDPYDESIDSTLTLTLHYSDGSTDALPFTSAPSVLDTNVDHRDSMDGGLDSHCR